MEKLKEILREKNLTIDQAAELLDVHRATIYRHLNGHKLTMETAKKYSHLLNIPIDEFLDYVA
jgi:plasmid maintenance system antidote protein VapI